MQNNNNNKREGIKMAYSVMQPLQLMKLFEGELKLIYWVEKNLTKAFPKMIDNATDQELVAALQNHLIETIVHVARVEQIFILIDKEANAKKCEAMAGLIKEAEEIIAECEEGAMRDAAIISAVQKVTHYEMASYETLYQFAQTLGLIEASKLLQATLHEEKAAVKKLMEVNIISVNIEASQQGTTK